MPITVLGLLPAKGEECRGMLGLRLLYLRHGLLLEEGESVAMRVLELAGEATNFGTAVRPLLRAQR